jgi:predicted Fe-Mo cluster-binding NifX family protein
MKIALPTIGGLLDEHLTLCEVFTILTINESDIIVDSEILYTPQGCDCKNNVPLILQQKGVTMVVAGTMPDYAEEVCGKFGIKVYQGYSGEIKSVALAFINNKMLNKD